LNEQNEIVLNAISWLHLLTKLKTFRKFYLRKNDYSPIFEFIDRHTENLIMEEVWGKESRNFPEFAKEIKLTMILRDWISEIHEKDISDRYNIGVGDLHRIVDNAKWLFRAIQQIAKLDPFSSEYSKSFQNLYYRITHGIRDSLVPLVKLKGIGRVKARKLYSGGFTSIEKIKSASIEELTTIPLIGVQLAANIQKQLQRIQGKGKKHKKRIQRTNLEHKPIRQQREQSENSSPTEKSTLIVQDQNASDENISVMEKKHTSKKNHSLDQFF
jgi:helicase